MRTSLIAVAVALCVACEAPVPQAPPGKLAGVRVVDLIPVSLSGETWQDAEPFLALYVSNPQLLAASAFTPNPGGSTSATAPIFVSNDGGDSWTLRNTLPSQLQTSDITHAVGGSPPALYAGILKVPGFPLNELKTVDFFSPATMTLQAPRADIDQPFVCATAFRALLDPWSRLPRDLVTVHGTTAGSNAAQLRQRRIGSILTIANAGQHNDTVYVTCADRLGTADMYTLHVGPASGRDATW